MSPGFLTQLDWLQVLKPVIDDQIVAEFNQVKRIKKEQLVQVLRAKEGVEVNPGFLFDVQIKRLHEYKRQLLNGFSILDIYYGLKEGTITDFTPTLFLFGAKSAPGYQRAKAIIRYLNQIAKLINSDPDVAGKMQVHYRLHFDRNGYAKFYVFKNCKEFIRTVPALVYDEDHPEDVDTKGEDHIYDECRYVMMENPITQPLPEKEPDHSFDPLNMYEGGY